LKMYCLGGKLSCNCYNLTARRLSQCFKPCVRLKHFTLLCFQENLNRSRLLFDHLDWWQAQGFEYDESTRAKATMQQQEALMKLFAVSSAMAAVKHNLWAMC
jgi:hypothetical protein